jgi:hypothetical protein
MDLANIMQRSLSGDYRDKKTVLSHYLAVNIALKLPLPTSEVDDLNQFYNSTCYVDVTNFMDRIHEEVVLDQAMLMQGVWNMYKMRYELTCGVLRKETMLAFAQMSIYNPEHHSPEKKALLCKDETVTDILKFTDSMSVYFHDLGRQLNGNEPDTKSEVAEV